MVIDERKRIQEKVRDEGWNIWWLAGDTPLNRQKVRILFERMSGGVAECEAVYKMLPASTDYFEGRGYYDGNRMAGIIAWKADRLEFEDEA